MNNPNLEKGIVGDPMDRVDGRLKVTGGAKYAGEFTATTLAQAVLLQSTIAKGKITRMDTADALRAPGVIAVITNDNKPNMKAPAMAGETIPLLSPDILYSGQSIAVVVAETLEQAEAGAQLVHVEYSTETPDIDMEKNLDKAFAKKGRGNSKRGDFAAGLAAAATKVDEVYRTPAEHHNPMEPHATVAIWNGDKLTVYDATQGVSGSAHSLAEQFMLDPKDVRTIDPFVGGGFGCKGQPWPHAALTAMAAKVVGRPVRLALTRRQMFTSNGHRPETRQAMTLGTDRDGKLVALQHSAHCHTSQHDDFVEPSGLPTSLLYSCPNVNVEQKLVRLNVGAPTYMRAPGESSGSFGQETAMDELAIALNMDPIELRLRNYAEKDESSGRPWSSKSLKECYQKGAEAFGWARRNPAVGSMRDGRFLVGYGMATATYPANFRQTSARARMFPDGTVLVQCGTQDLGTGTYTILTQIASQALGVPPHKIRVEIGDSSLPMAPGSGGSVSATSSGSAVKLACESLRDKLLALASADPSSHLAGTAPTAVVARDGQLFSQQDGNQGVSYREIMSKYGGAMVEAEATAKPGPERGQQQGQQGGQPAAQAHTMQAFGAQFCEVHIDPDLRTIKVARCVGAFALGKVLNAKTLTSQLQGGIVWGIGMGLLEESVPDPIYARYLNSNLAEYHVPVNKDVPPIEIILVAEEDHLVSPLGAKGAGEIGITGVAAALGNAVYHATGKRVRDLPITLDKIL